MAGSYHWLSYPSDFLRVLIISVTSIPLVGHKRYVGLSCSTGVLEDTDPLITKLSFEGKMEELGTEDRTPIAEQELVELMERFEASVTVTAGDEVKEGGGKAEEGEEKKRREPDTRYQDMGGDLGEGLNTALGNFTTFWSDNRNTYPDMETAFEAHKRNFLQGLIGSREAMGRKTIAMKKGPTERREEGGGLSWAAGRLDTVPEPKTQPRSFCRGTSLFQVACAASGWPAVSNWQLDTHGFCSVHRQLFNKCSPILREVIITISEESAPAGPLMEGSARRPTNRVQPKKSLLKACLNYIPAKVWDNTDYRWWGVAWVWDRLHQGHTALRW